MIHDMDIANQTFPAFRSDLNNALKALASNFSNDTAPDTTFPHQFWVDTNNNANSDIYIRNKSNSNWILVGTIDDINNLFVGSGATNAINSINTDNIKINPDNSSNVNRFITFTTANPNSSTNQQLYTDSSLTYNPLTNTLSTNIDGSVSGTASSLSSSVTILGQTFNGTQNISLVAGSGINITGGNTISVTGNLNVTSIITSNNAVINNGLDVKAVGGTEGGEIKIYNNGEVSVGLFLDVATTDIARLFQTNANSTMQIGKLGTGNGKVQFYTSGARSLELNDYGQLQLFGNRFYHYDDSFVQDGYTINATNFEMGYGVGTGDRRFYGLNAPSQRLMAFYANGTEYFRLTQYFLPILALANNVVLNLPQSRFHYSYGYYNPVGYSSNAELLCIQPDGYVGKQPASTKRVKMDIKTLNDASFIMNLRPVTFKRKKMINGVYVNTPLSEQFEYGFIAEEAAQADERLATYEKIRDENGNIIIQPNGISYVQFLSPAIRFVQQLKEEIEILKQEIKDLRSMIQ